MWRFFDPNPHGTQVGDCAVRAICAATDKPWDEVYLNLCLDGMMAGDWGSSNAVWGGYLRKLGYVRDVIPNTCPDCYTVEKFCEDHPSGTYILAISGHVVCVKNGENLDTWDSSKCVPLYYWHKEDEQ